MNVTKQDAMDDKIKERCKTCEKNACKRISMDQEAVEKLSRGYKVSRSIDLAIERCRDCDKKQLKSSIEKPGVKRCRGTIKIA